MDEIADLKNKVAMLLRAMSTIDKERQNDGKAPLFDAQILAINARVAQNVSGSNTPRVRKDAFPPAMPKGAA